MRLDRGAWLLVLLAMGCRVKGTKATLEELGGARLLLTQELDHVKLEVISDTVRGELACPELTDARGRLDGRDLEQEEKGAAETVLIGGRCLWPRWAFKLPPETQEVSELEVTDQTGQMLYGVSSLSAHRSLTYEGPSPGPKAGDLVTFRWWPATDELNDVRVVVDGTRVVASSVVAVRNGRIGFIFPPDIPSGLRTISIGTWIRPGTVHCEPDPATCDAHFSTGELLPSSQWVTVSVQ